MRHQAPMMVTSSATQIEMDRCPAKAPVMVGCLFSDGFFAGAFTGDTGQGRYSSLPHHEDRFGGYSFNRAFGLPYGDFGRALLGLELSNYVQSPLRVGIEEWGVQGGDEGDRAEGTSDIQGIDTSYQANQLVLALTEVKTTYAVEALGDVESSSPLMSINPLGAVVMTKLNYNNEVKRLDNTLKVSN